MQYININFFEDLVEIKYKSSKAYLVRDFLKQEAYTEVRKELNSLVKDKRAWVEVPLQEDYQRKSLKYGASPLLVAIVNEMKSEEFLQKINTLDINVKVFGGSIWWDTEGYHIVMHVDNEAVTSAFQVYLGEETNPYLGTSFGYSDNTPFLTIPYRPNFGYFFTNTNDFLHGLITKVPKDFNRLSLYTIGGYN
jgi:cell fate (sporulation/competence/biofilm development) regulator YmcA (YheA/YmcA/DUF963 family)